MSLIFKTKYNWPIIFLRIGLAFVLIYAGIAMLRYPVEWKGFLPSFILNGSIIKPDLFLQIHAIGEILLGSAILFAFLKRITSLLVLIDIALIIFVNGIDAVTFRDIGLAFTALALFVYYLKR